MSTFDEEIKLAADALKKGKVILYPTDTIWGIGCDATSSAAVSRLIKIKRRTDNKSLIALIDEIDRITEYVKVVPPIAYDLIQNAANPISIVFPGAKNIAKNALGPESTVCIRVTDSQFCKQLVKAFGKPIASTSANVSGEPTPLFFAKISEEIKKNVDHIVSLYQDEIKMPKATTIIKLDVNGQFTILRH